MVLYVVAVKDRALDAFMRPFTVPHRNAAVRSFVDEVNRPDGEMFKHPDDYDLYFVCSWDEVSGKMFDAPPQPELLVRGKDSIKGE